MFWESFEELLSLCNILVYGIVSYTVYDLVVALA